MRFPKAPPKWLDPVWGKAIDDSQTARQARSRAKREWAQWVEELGEEGEAKGEKGEKAAKTPTNRKRAAIKGAKALADGVDDLAGEEWSAVAEGLPLDLAVEAVSRQVDRLSEEERDLVLRSLPPKRDGEAALPAHGLVSPLSGQDQVRADEVARLAAALEEADDPEVLRELGRHLVRLARAALGVAMEQEAEASRDSREFLESEESEESDGPGTGPGHNDMSE